MRNWLNLARIGFFVIVHTGVVAISAYAQQSLPVPDKPVVPNIELNTIDGHEWSVHANRGNILVLNFWATWCQPCRTETPLLVKIANEYADRGVKVAGIALDEGGEVLIRKFAAEYKVDYPILIPPAGSPLFGMSEVPTTLLINAEGRLEQKYVGAVPEGVLRADIERIAEHASPVNSRGRSN